jgi:hypothetical protein
MSNTIVFVYNLMEIKMAAGKGGFMGGHPRSVKHIKWNNSSYCSWSSFEQVLFFVFIGWPFWVVIEFTRADG